MITSKPMPATEQLGMATLLALFLVPGALMTLAFVVVSPIVESAGFPPIAALLVVIGSSSSRSSSASSDVPGVATISGSGRSCHTAGRCRSGLGMARPALGRLAFVGFGVSMAVEPAVIDGAFGWLPDWFVRPIDVDRLTDFSRDAWLVTLTAYLVLNGIIGPIVEELYFRGYLLPRMEWMGRWAPLVNVSLFSLYHFWSPWQIVGRILGFGPTVYAVRWKENVYLGMVVHCTLNTLGVAIVAGLVLGRV